VISSISVLRAELQVSATGNATAIYPKKIDTLKSTGKLIQTMVVIKSLQIFTPPRPIVHKEMERSDFDSPTFHLS